jgi:hypothetical protein
MLSTLPSPLPNLSKTVPVLSRSGTVGVHVPFSVYNLLTARTTVGKGSAKQGTEAVHGSPQPADDLKQVKQLYGFDPEQAFVVPPEVHVSCGPPARAVLYHPCIIRIGRRTF